MKKLLLAVTLSLTSTAHAAEVVDTFKQDLVEARAVCGKHIVDYILSMEIADSLISIDGVPWRIVGYNQHGKYVQRYFLARGENQALIDFGNVSNQRMDLSFYDIDGKTTEQPQPCANVQSFMLIPPTKPIADKYK